jgi:hypothetical protein
MEERSNMGYLETRSRIMEELLEKTAFKDSLRLFLKNIDPEDTARLVRILLGTDIEVPLAVTGALPVLANSLIRAGHELVVQVRDKFSPELLAGFAESLLEEIDKETLASLINDGRALGKDLAPVFQAAWKVVEDKAFKAREDV